MYDFDPKNLNIYLLFQISYKIERKVTIYDKDLIKPSNIGLRIYNPE